MAYQQQTGKEHEKIANAPRLPAGMEVLWRDFMDLHTSRASSGFGPCPISFVDIDAWQRVRGVSLPSWQITAIKRADSAYFASIPNPKGGK